jgi:RimJ/RimL family protein N-acetyltransferase
MSETNTGEAAACYPQPPRRGLAFGEHTALRPVLEDDLPALAKLMAENPAEPERQPWTLQRLKARFDDKDNPGLWSSKDKLRLHVIVRSGGGEVVGYLREHEDWHGGVYYNHIHVNEQLAGWQGLLRDALRTYRSYKCEWFAVLRISYDILGCEEEKAQCLESEGYALELRMERMYLWLGKPQARCTHTWISERLERELAKREGE